MPKYTEEQLFEAREQAFNPKPEILENFNKLIESVREHHANEKRLKQTNGDTYIDEKGNERSYNLLNRRRLSRSGGTTKPTLRRKTETTIDLDGWATTTKAKVRKSFSTEDETDERDQFRELIRDTTLKVRPNNKNLGSSKAVDPRDIVADKHTKAYNAFAALEGDDDE